MKISIALATMLLLSSTAMAQTSSYNGTWNAAYKNDQGSLREGVVVVEDLGGTFVINGQVPSNPCAGLKVPIAVEQATAEELSFQVIRSKVMAGCRDSTVRMKPLDAKTLEGTYDDRKFKMTKKD